MTVQDGVPVAYPGCHGVGVRVVHPVNPRLRPAKDLGLVMFYLPPHVILEPGSHETEETYVILAGSRRMTFARSERDVSRAISSTAWCVHGIENTGSETLVVLIATSPPNP